MKKIGVLVLVAALTGAAAFAQPDFSLSAGVGGFLFGHLTGGVEVSGDDQTTTVNSSMLNMTVGGYAFFDATYAELSLGFGGGTGFIDFQGGSDYVGFWYNTTALHIELLGKYPFQLSPKFTLFPMLGVGYHIVTSREFDTEESSSGGEGSFKDKENSDFNALSIKLGVGFDIPFTDKIFLRFATVFGYQLPSKYDNDSIDEYNKMSGYSASLTPGFNWDMIRLAVGFRF
jgi:outer membrane protein W